MRNRLRGRLVIADGRKVDRERYHMDARRIGTKLQEILGCGRRSSYIPRCPCNQGSSVVKLGARAHVGLQRTVVGDNEIDRPSTSETAARHGRHREAV